MNVLITTSILPPEVGGPATYVPLLAEELALRGHQITLIAPQIHRISLQDENKHYRIIYYQRAQYIRYINYLIELIRALSKILSEGKKNDLLYSNGLDLAASIGARILRKPIVIKVVGDPAWEFSYNRGLTKHNLEEFQQERGLQINFIKWLFHLPFKKADKIILPGYQHFKFLQEWGIPSEKIIVIYNAPSPPKSRLELAANIRNMQGFNLFMAGRLIPLKRIDQVIDLVSTIEDVNLIIAGEGPLRESLAKKVDKLGLQSRVHLLGSISKELVWSLLCDYAQVLIINSVYETFPNIVLEALTCGVPVISTKVGGINEIIQDRNNGILIPLDNPQCLADAIQLLKSDEVLRHKLAIQALQSSKIFNVDTMVLKTEKILLGVIN